MAGASLATWWAGREAASGITSPVSTLTSGAPYQACCFIALAFTATNSRSVIPDAQNGRAPARTAGTATTSAAPDILRPDRLR